MSSSFFKLIIGLMLLAVLIQPIAAEACSFCEFINLSKGDPGPQGPQGEMNQTPGPAGTTSHNLLLNLTSDDHPQYPNMSGRAGGQTIQGGVIKNENLTLIPSSSGGSVVVGGSGVFDIIPTGSEPHLYYTRLQSAWSTTNTFDIFGYNQATGLRQNILKYSSGNQVLALQPAGGRVGVGTTNPVGKFEVATEGAIQIDAFSVYSNTSTDEALFYLRRGRGTFAVPAIVQNGDTLGSLRFASQYSSTVGVYTTVAKIVGIANGTQALTSLPTDLAFFVAPTGSTIPIERVRISNDGRLLVGVTSSPTNAQLDVAAGVTFRNCSGTPVFGTNGELVCTSDEKVKKDIKDYNKIAPLPKPIQWNFNSASGYDTTVQWTGFSAQDVEVNYPECIISRPDVKYENRCTGKGEKAECTPIELPTGTFTKSIDQTCLLAASFNKINSLETKLNNICKNDPKLCEATP